MFNLEGDWLSGPQCNFIQLIVLTILAEVAHQQNMHLCQLIFFMLNRYTGIMCFHQLISSNI